MENKQNTLLRVFYLRKDVLLCVFCYSFTTKRLNKANENYNRVVTYAMLYHPNHRFQHPLDSNLGAQLV